MKQVRVRFAPSPTGFLHVGGARTAIFNWLFAKNQNGKFLIRIEDTDPERSKSELSKQIIRSLDWLEMFSDEPVVYQSDRLNRYQEAVENLVSAGKAYYAFETNEELDAKRAEAKAMKKQFKYDRAGLKLSKEEIKQNLENGKDYVVRFFIPEGEIVFYDIVHGETRFKNSDIDDFILLRSDGSPVYQVAVVVDDHDMEITHVIRGDDHLANTPKQILLYKAFGWDVPEFAHLPMILDEQKRKLSKRRNPVSAEVYEEIGYLPEALFNFLTLLGFAPENNLEIVPKQEMVRMFTFERVNKSSAVFDMKKLNWMNSEYIKMKDENILAELVKVKLAEKNIPVPDNSYIIKAVNLMKERVSTINDFIEFGPYFYVEPEYYDEKGLAKYWNPEAKGLLQKYLSEFEALKDNDYEKHLRDFSERNNIKPAVLIHPIRLALSGITVGPGLFELMEVLGKEKVIQRLKRFIEMKT